MQGLLLSAYLKMLLADPNDDQLRQQVGAVYERYSHFMDADLQQRAVEYQGLLKLPEVANRNVTAMPKWEKRKSLLLRRMAEKDVWKPSLNSACVVICLPLDCQSLYGSPWRHSIIPTFRKPVDTSFLSE